MKTRQAQKKRAKAHARSKAKTASKNREKLSQIKARQELKEPKCEKKFGKVTNKAEQIKTTVELAPKSNVGKSVRRIFSNLLYEPMEAKGHFHVDRMGPSGTSILIKHDDKFFALTAWHVLEKTFDLKRNEVVDGSFGNESPFWLSTTFEPRWESMYDFLMPKRIWNISELVGSDDELFSLIDIRDFVLIELFDPLPLHQPDHYIEIDSIDDVLTLDDADQGLFTWVSGYPYKLNNFVEAEDLDKLKGILKPVDNATHGTAICRQSAIGMLKVVDGNCLISFEIGSASESSHQDFNGMSGGAIYDAHPNQDDIKLLGMLVSAGGGIARFIPAEIIVPCILRYKESSSIVVDPRADVLLSPEEAFEFVQSYVDQFGISRQPSNP